MKDQILNILREGNASDKERALIAAEILNGTRLTEGVCHEFLRASSDKTDAALEELYS